jgi:hypothetical protein
VKKLIVDARVTMVSLCRRGKNTLKTLYKGEGGARLQALVKASAEFDERGQLLAVVAAPNLEDADGDTFESPEAIERAAHHFLRAGADLDLHHDLQPLKKDDAFVAESFVIQKGDSRFADWSDYEGHKVDVTGGWGMVIQIDDPTLRKSYRDGEWDGVSLYAPVARMRTVAKADTSIASELRKVFEDAGIINPQTDEDFDMDAKELAEVLKASNTELVKAVVAAVTPAAPKKEDAKDEIAAPIFKGDPTDPKALLAHKHAIEVHRLMTSGAQEGRGLQCQARGQRRERRAAQGPRSRRGAGEGLQPERQRQAGRG